MAAPPYLPRRPLLKAASWLSTEARWLRDAPPMICSFIAVQYVSILIHSSHVVPSPGHEDRPAGVDCLNEGNPCNAPPTALAEALFVEGDHKRRFVVVAHEP